MCLNFLKIICIKKYQTNAAIISTCIYVNGSRIDFSGYA